MLDGQVNISCVAAWALWATSVALIISGGVSGLWPLGQAGLACSAAAATVTVRGFFTRQQVMMLNAFELGRDSVRHLR
jgi:hypothetical protein